MNDVRFCYLHDKKHHVTIARVVNFSTREIKFSLASVHTDDQFIKNRGKQIAWTRLFLENKESNKIKNFTIELDLNLTPTESIMFFLSNQKNYNTKNHSIPRYVSKLAYNWLDEHYYSYGQFGDL